MPTWKPSGTDSRKAEYLLIAILAMLLGGGAAIQKNGALLVGLLIPGIVLISVVSDFRIKSIELDNENAVLRTHSANKLRRTKTNSYPLSSVELTYKRQATSLRSGIKNVLILYVNGKDQLMITPDDELWTDEDIKTLVRGLLESGIPRKFIGYTLKDAEI